LSEITRLSAAIGLTLGFTSANAGIGEEKSTELGEGIGDAVGEDLPQAVSINSAPRKNRLGHLLFL